MALIEILAFVMLGVFNKLFLTLRQLLTNVNHFYLLHFLRTQTFINQVNSSLFAAVSIEMNSGLLYQLYVSSRTTQQQAIYNDAQ